MRQSFEIILVSNDSACLRWSHRKDMLSLIAWAAFSWPAERCTRHARHQTGSQHHQQVITRNSLSLSETVCEQASFKSASIRFAVNQKVSVEISKHPLEWDRTEIPQRDKFGEVRRQKWEKRAEERVTKERSLKDAPRYRVDVSHLRWGYELWTGGEIPKSYLSSSFFRFK